MSSRRETAGKRALDENMVMAAQECTPCLDCSIGDDEERRLSIRNPILTLILKIRAPER